MRRIMSILLCAASSLAAVTSCSAQPAKDRAPDDAVVERDVMVSMRDGVKLATDIARPKGIERCPVILSRTPYSKGLGGTGFATKAGCAFVVQDVRGRYKSEGEFAAFRHEINDAYDTIEWLAQQPWCDGNVAMAGGSYLGFTQVAAAMSKSPHLRCILPAVPPADFDFGTAFWGGALRQELVQGWLLGQAWTSQRVLSGSVPSDELARLRGYRSFTSWCRHVPLADPGPISIGGDAYIQSWHDMLGSWEHPGVWRPLSAAQRPEEVQVPVLIKGGFYDIFCQEDINLVLALRQRGGSELSRKHSHLLIGPWTHGIGQATGDVNFAAAKAMANAGDGAWYARWLRNQGAEEVDRWPAIRAFVMNQDRWIDTDTWPPPQAVATRFYLGANKGLTTNNPAGDAASDTFSYNPENPVPTLGGGNLTIVRGIHDHRKNAARPDVLNFATEPLATDLTVVGRLRAHLFVSSSAPDTDFTAMLVDVRPDGYVANVQDGIVRLRYRAGRDKPQLVQPGQVVEADIDLWSTAYCFKAGHRLGLLVSSSNFPRFDRNLNVAEAPEHWTTPAVAQNAVYHDAQRASYVELPVMGGQ